MRIEFVLDKGPRRLDDELLFLGKTEIHRQISGKVIGCVLRGSPAKVLFHIVNKLRARTLY
jgi:hypothetical protein